MIITNKRPNRHDCRHLDTKNAFRRLIKNHSLNFASYIFYPIKKFYSIKDYSKKLSLSLCRFPFLFTGSLIITLLSLTSVYANKPIIEDNGDIRANQTAVLKHEQSGDYSQGLKIARKNYEDLLKMDPSKDAKDFLDTVHRLENNLLNFGFSRLLFDEHYQPRVKLLQLLDILGMEPLNKSEEAILKINTWAQNNLLRRGERWEEQTNKFEDLTPKIKPLLAELGFVNAAYPHFKQYQGAIIHGGLLTRMRHRLEYLVEQWHQGVRFSHIYFLTGERPLNTDHENYSIFMDDSDCLLKIRKDISMPSHFPQTESDIAQLIWEQYDIPEAMRKAVVVHFINAPMKKNGQSEKLIRPTTGDTVIDWLSSSPPHGHYLAVSNAPYIYRQDLVIRALTPSVYCFDTIGKDCNENEKIAIILDELARYIYQLKQCFQK